MSASGVGQEPKDSGYISVMIPYAVYRKFAWYLAAVKSPLKVEEFITPVDRRHQGDSARTPLGSSRTRATATETAL
jgi:hypothetical protein